MTKRRIWIEPHNREAKEHSVRTTQTVIWQTSGVTPKQRLAVRMWPDLLSKAKYLNVLNRP
jgi:hypothetical protein